MHLSVCMIVKNEAHNLRRCLASLGHIGRRAAPDDPLLEIRGFIGDTGSTDATREVARGLGAEVFDVPWTDHFADARNAVLDAARDRGGWILSLDADEHLDPDTAPLIFDAMRDESAVMFLLALNDNAGGYRMRVPRLFRNHPDIRWQGRLHETVDKDVDSWAREYGQRVKFLETMIHHEGNTEARRKEKNPFYERMYRLWVKDDETASYPHYVYAMWRAGHGDASGSTSSLRRAVRLLKEEYEHAPAKIGASWIHADIMAAYVLRLLIEDNIKECIKQLSWAQNRLFNSQYLLFVAGKLALRLGAPDTARYAFETAAGYGTQVLGMHIPMEELAKAIEETKGLQPSP